MKITIPNYRARSRNKTATAHWRVYQLHRNEIAELIGTYTPSRECISPAVVTIEAFYMQRPVDTTNVDDKIVVDGLMRAGILIDDKPQENPIVIKKCFVDAEEDKLVITVEKYEMPLDKVV